MEMSACCWLNDPRCALLIVPYILQFSYLELGGLTIRQYIMNHPDSLSYMCVTIDCVHNHAKCCCRNLVWVDGTCCSRNMASTLEEFKKTGGRIILPGKFL